MKKMVVWVTAGLFVLSLQGAALAQKEEKAPEVMPPPMESQTPMTPAEKPAAPAKAKKTCKKNTPKKKTAKACKPKKKKVKTAKKVV